MKNKKSEKANLENKKGVFFLTGLVIALAMVLFAFEWKTETKAVEIFGEASFTAEDFIFIPHTQAEQKEIPKQKIEVPILEIVDNNSKIDENLDLFDSEITDETFIDFENIIFKSKEPKEEPQPEFFDFVQEMPEFPGGELSLLKYLSSQIKYPVIAQENGIQGKVYVSFIINEDGSVSNVNLMRGIDPSLDTEALRVVRSMPKWKPGKQRGKAVKVRYNVPINFELR